MIRWFAAAAVAGSVALSQAIAVEPRSISTAEAVKDDMGVVRLSVRSQSQLGGTLHLWFIRDGGDAANEADVLKFERKQGVPLAGTNTIDSRPKVYRVRPGSYRLLAHGVNCDGVPPENTVCVVSMGGNSWKQPTGRYATPSPTFQVVAGALTDAGEFVLEFPAGTVIGQPLPMQDALERLMSQSIRWRPVAAPVPPAFASLPVASPTVVPEGFRSNLRCEQKPKDAKGMMLYYPFDCPSSLP